MVAAHAIILGIFLILVGVAVTAVTTIEILLNLCESFQTLTSLLGGANLGGTFFPALNLFPTPSSPILCQLPIGIIFPSIP